MDLASLLDAHVFHELTHGVKSWATIDYYEVDSYGEALLSLSLPFVSLILIISLS